jgi:hypothetical protein
VEGIVGHIRAVPTVGAVALCLLLSGCGSKVTESNYDKIRNGMTLREVEDILGKGEERSGGDDKVGKTGSSKSSIENGGGIPVDEIAREIVRSGKTFVWKENFGSGKIIIQFLQGKVSQKMMFREGRVVKE